MQPTTRSFVSVYNRLSNVLQNRVHVAEAFNLPTITDKTTLRDLGAKEYGAIWDTGATNTIITQKVVNDLGLKPVGVTQLDTANDKKDAPLYLVAIFLPNKILISELMVAEATVTSDAEILIGMDIIGSGDFAVTNKDKKTVFTFRIPSIKRIDFVEETKAQRAIRNPVEKVGRNDPCPCGSGKKYKKCCGR